MLKEKECQQKCLDLSKLSFENEKEIKAVLYLKKKKNWENMLLRNLTTSNKGSPSRRNERTVDST